VTFILFFSKVFRSQSSVNFLFNSTHCVRSAENPSIVGISRETDGSGGIEGDAACIVGRVIVAVD
jgi:hypothetical protein